MVAVTITIPTSAKRDLQLSKLRIISRIYKNQVDSLIFEPLFKMTPTIAIVILNYNGRRYLEQFLPFVTANTCPGGEVIIADNASTDDSLAFLKEKYPELRVIVLDRNYGFAEPSSKGYHPRAGTTPCSAGKHIF